MDSCMGAPDWRLVERFGQPERKAPDNKGGEMWIYSKYKQGYMPNGQVIAAYEYYIFYLDPNAVVYGWRTDRQPVPVQQVNVNLYVR
jgi:hypothetical protein